MSEGKITAKLGLDSGHKAASEFEDAPAFKSSKLNERPSIESVIKSTQGGVEGGKPDKSGKYPLD